MNKYLYIILGILAVAIIGVMGYFGYSHSISWKSYVETDFGFRVSYPENWDLRDDLKDGKCCLFIAYPYVLERSSTTTAAGETITTVSMQDIVKIQMGNYDKASYDPYKEGSTTPLVLGKNTWHVGKTPEMNFYLLPKDEKTGIGAAIFTSTDVSKELIANTMLTAMQILSSVKYAKK